MSYTKLRKISNLTPNKVLQECTYSRQEYGSAQQPSFELFIFSSA